MPITFRLISIPNQGKFKTLDPAKCRILMRHTEQVFHVLQWFPTLHLLHLFFFFYITVGTPNNSLLCRLGRYAPFNYAMIIVRSLMGLVNAKAFISPRFGFQC